MIDHPVLFDEQRTPPKAVMGAAELRLEPRDGSNKDAPAAGDIAWQMWADDAARDRSDGLLDPLREVGA